jgi:glycosyltransferase involved in cell wall biosynthesis
MAMISRRSDRPRVLFVVDVPGWAYDDCAQNWKQLLVEEFEIDIAYLGDAASRKLEADGAAAFERLVRLANADLDDRAFLSSARALTTWVRSHSESLVAGAAPFDHGIYRGVVFFYSRALRDPRMLGTAIPSEKIAVIINNEKWVEEGATVTVDRYLSEASVVVACNSFILDAFAGKHPRVVRASQAINDNTFSVTRENMVRPTRVGDEFVIGWSGDYKNPIKNVPFVREVCDAAGVKLLISKNRTREELCDWYNNSIDAVLCASSSEGGPLMLLEAGACARPIISTPVGLVREIVRHGETGLMVPHGDKQKTVEAVRLLANDLELRARLAIALHEEVKSRWTLRARLHEIRHALETLCG